MVTATSWVNVKLDYLLFVCRLNPSVICVNGKGPVETLALKLHVSTAYESSKEQLYSLRSCKFKKKKKKKY